MSCTVGHPDGALDSIPNHKCPVLDSAKFDQPTCSVLLGIGSHLKLEMVPSFINAKVYLQMCRTIKASAGRQYHKACLKIKGLHEMAVSGSLVLPATWKRHKTMKLTQIVGWPGRTFLAVAVSFNQVSTNPAETVRTLQTSTFTPPEATPDAKSANSCCTAQKFSKHVQSSLAKTA